MADQKPPDRPRRALGSKGAKDKAPRRPKPGRPGSGRRDMPPGPGRPKGSRSKAAHGLGRAIRTLHWRIPEGTPPEVAEVAGIALGRIANIATGAEPYGFGTFASLKACAMFREEVCGAITQKQELSGSVTFEVVTGIDRDLDDR